MNYQVQKMAELVAQTKKLQLHGARMDFGNAQILSTIGAQHSKTNAYQSKVA